MEGIEVVIEKENLARKETRKNPESYHVRRKFCLAGMTAKEDLKTGAVTVINTTTHTSHTLEHLPLPKSVTTRVKILLARGVQMKRAWMVWYGCVKFLTEIRGNLGSRVNRDYFKANATRKLIITRQDCQNIGRKLKEFKMHRHTNDAVSVDRLVHELQQESPSPVIAYKPQLPKKSMNFQTIPFLVTITPFQADVFCEFSKKIVCLDSTHQANQYKHKLVTMVVADEFHKGMIALLLINKLRIVCILT